MFVRIGVHWWDVWNQNCIDLWFRNVNIHHVHACCRSLNHFHHCSNHYLCNRRITEKENNQCPRVIFCFEITEFSILEFFRIFDILCFLLQLILHIQYAPILLLLMGDLVCMPLLLFGFSFLVVIEIGSLARFTCFSNVDLSCIFWSIWNPFFQNTVSSLLMCFLSLLWNSLQ